MRDLERTAVKIRRHRPLMITPLEVAALAIRWAAVAFIVAGWIVVAMIVGR